MKKIIYIIATLLLLTGCERNKEPEELLAHANNTLISSKNGIVEIRLTLDSDGDKTVLNKIIQYDKPNNIMKTTLTQTTTEDTKQVIGYTDISGNKVINYASVNNNWYTIEGELGTYLAPKNINFLLEPLSAFNYVNKGNEDWHQVTITDGTASSLIFDSFGMQPTVTTTNTTSIDVRYHKESKTITNIEYNCNKFFDLEESDTCKMEISYDKIDIAGNLQLDSNAKNNTNETYQSEEVTDIFDIINTSKNNVHALSAEGLLEAIRLEYTYQLMDSSPQYEMEFNFTLQNENAQNLSMYGKKPIDGIVIIKDGVFTKVENIRFEGMKQACIYNYKENNFSC